jgi:hypothetical protein
MYFKDQKALKAYINKNPGLTHLRIDNYEANKLPRLPDSLIELAVSKCHELENLLGLPNLKGLRIEACRNLKSFHSPGTLSELYVKNCPLFTLPELPAA